MPDRFAPTYGVRTVAITGASDYLGGALALHLREAGAQVTWVSRQHLPALAGTNVLVGDIREPGIWHDLVTAKMIFHLAGETSTCAADKNPLASLAANVAPIIHLAAAARASGRCPTVILDGTVTQVGMPTRIPVNESVANEPVTIYDLHKLTAERQLKLAAAEGMQRGACLRLANVYGAGPNANGAADRALATFGIVDAPTEADSLAGVPVRETLSQLPHHDVVIVTGMRDTSAIVKQLDADFIQSARSAPRA